MKKYKGRLVHLDHFTVSPPVIPKFYWDVYSQEQRLEHMAKMIEKFYQYLSKVTDIVNDLDIRVQMMEDDVEEIKQDIQKLYQLIELLRLLSTTWREHSTNSKEVNNEISQFKQKSTNV